MKTHEQLAQWLGNNARTYQDGVRLFTDLNIDVKQLGFFAAKDPGKVHMSILFRKLENYARVNGIKSQATKTQEKKQELPVKPGKAPRIEKPDKPVIERPRIDTNPTVKKEDLPEDLQLLFDQNGMMNNQTKTLHAELKVAAKNNAGTERIKTLANQIVHFKNQMRENWQKIDAWWNKKNGKTPEQIAAEDAIRKKNRIVANLNYIRRYNNTTKASQQEELAKRKLELDQWEVSYEELVAKVTISE
jgi:hypothetical protein